MRNRSRQFDMAHTLAPHPGQGDFDTAFFADNTFVLHAFIFAAETFIVLDRAKNARAEQAIAFRLEGPVVDGFWLLDLAK